MNIEQKKVWDILADSNKNKISDDTIDAMIYAMPLSKKKKDKKIKELGAYINFWRHQERKE